MPRERLLPEHAREAAILEQRTFDLLCDIAVEMNRNASNILTVQFMRDQDLQPIRDRTMNDLHAFLEVACGTIYHIRAYLCHMLARRRAEGGDPKPDFPDIALTGYRKQRIELHGGIHSLRQDRYPWDPVKIAREVIEQNADLFLQRDTNPPPAGVEGTTHTAG